MNYNTYSYPIPMSGNYCIIALSNNLVSNSTRLGFASTFIHEFLHAYLGRTVNGDKVLQVTKKINPNNTAPFTLEHAVIAEKYIDAMVDFLDKYATATGITIPDVNPIQPTKVGYTAYFKPADGNRKNYLKALVWGQLQQTKAFVNIFGAEIPGSTGQYLSGSAAQAIQDIYYAEGYFNSTASKSSPKIGE